MMQNQVLIDNTFYINMENEFTHLNTSELIRINKWVNAELDRRLKILIATRDNKGGLDSDMQIEWEFFR